MKLNKNTYDDLMSKTIWNNHLYSQPTYIQHAITDPFEAMEFFREIIMACFNQDRDKLLELKEYYNFDFRECFYALELSEILTGGSKSISENSSGNDFSMTTTYKIPTVLTNKGMKYYNDICSETIWNKALNAFKKNEIDPRFPYVVELCKYLNK